VHENIETVPFLAKALKYRGNFVIGCDVAREEQIGVLSESL